MFTICAKPNCGELYLPWPNSKSVEIKTELLLDIVPEDSKPWPDIWIFNSHEHCTNENINFQNVGSVLLLPFECIFSAFYIWWLHQIQFHWMIHSIGAQHKFTGVLQVSCSEGSKKSPVNYQRLSPLITHVANIRSANFTKGGLHH